MVGRLRGASKISELAALSLLCTIPASHGFRNLQVARFLTIGAVHVHSRETPATQTCGRSDRPDTTVRLLGTLHRALASAGRHPDPIPATRRKIGRAPCRERE